jgi:hypothetical protein
MYERQCQACGWIVDVNYPADEKTFRCCYCSKPMALSRAMKSLRRMKQKLHVWH